jgi:hypothetical protein
VREEILRKIPSNRLAVYFVWEAIQSSDTKSAAERASSSLTDPRVRNYWTDSPEVGTMFLTVMKSSEPVWDVFLVYPGGVTWDGAEPPAPTWFAHQLGSRMIAHPIKNAEELALKIRSTLPG